MNKFPSTGKICLLWILILSLGFMACRKSTHNEPKQKQEQGQAKPKEEEKKEEKEKESKEVDTPKPAAEMLEEPSNTEPELDVAWEKISESDYTLSSDGMTLTKWLNKNVEYIDMEADARLKQVKHIGESAFRDCGNLKNIKLPNSLLRIETSAFQNCNNLSAINFPPQLESLGEAAFYLTGLKSVRVTQPIKEVGTRCFELCVGLKEVSFSKSVHKLGTHTLSQCYELEEVVLWAHTLIPFPEKFLQTSSKLKTIYVQKPLLEQYQQAEGWKTYVSKIKALE